jgi:hypothetical protein
MIPEEENANLALNRYDDCYKLHEFTKSLRTHNPIMLNS